MTVGVRLGQEALRRGISHETAAEQIGVSQATFSRWVAGDNPPRSEYWARIARFLRTNRDDVGASVILERQVRSRRGTDERLAELEGKVDDLAGLVQELLAQLTDGRADHRGGRSAGRSGN